MLKMNSRAMMGPYRRLGRTLRLALWMGHVLACTVLSLLSLLLVRHAETAGGRRVGLASLMLLLGSLMPWLGVWRRTRWAGAVLTVILLAGGVVSLRQSMRVAPSGHLPDDNFAQVFSGDTRFAARALPTLVPEVDQLILGTCLFSHLDPYIDSAQGARVRELITGIYGELRQAPAFVEAGSALGMCYEDLFANRRRTLHMYTYVPRQFGHSRYPVMIFLHGSLGNFKAYTWVLKSLADAEGMAIVAPTYGAGNWDRDKASAVLDAVLDYCQHQPTLDSGRLILAGLSNGGRGVTRGIQNHGGRYRAVVLISPVIESRITATPRFREHVADLPLLILHGEEDRRIPVGQIRESEGALHRAGAHVTSRYYPGEDHFLLFSQRRSVMAEVGGWLRRSGVLSGTAGP